MAEEVHQRGIFSIAAMAGAVALVAALFMVSGRRRQQDNLSALV
jgi:hypothetical protein